MGCNMARTILSISILISRNFDGVKRCLDSLRPILDKVSSRLILTDTGCGEEVRSLIEGFADEYGGIILDFEWIKDFSAARNIGLEKAKELDCEWFMYIDDDEWFDADSLSELIFFLNSKKSNNYNVATYIQRNYLDMEGTDYSDYVVDRILRISPTLHFEHRIHEEATGVGEIQGGLKKKRLGVVANHFGYVYKNEEERKAKSMRNRELLLLECEEYPDNMRMRHQLVMDYFHIDEYDQAITMELRLIRNQNIGIYYILIYYIVVISLRIIIGLLNLGRNSYSRRCFRKKHLALDSIL